MNPIVKILGSISFVAQILQPTSMSASTQKFVPATEPPLNVEYKPIPNERLKPLPVGGKWESKFSQSKFVIHAEVQKVTYSQMVNADKSIHPITYVDFKILKFLKGSYKESTATLAFVFGPIANGERIYMQEGVPLFVAGDNLFLFLEKNGDELNPVNDDSLLFVHKDELYNPESNRILIDQKGDLFLGKSEEIDSILSRDIQIKGVNLRYEASPLPDQDESGLERVTVEKFEKFLNRFNKPSNEAFKTSKFGDFAKSDYAGSPEVAPRNAFESK